MATNESTDNPAFASTTGRGTALLPDDFSPLHNHELQARLSRLSKPHRDDLTLWILRHHYGMNSVKIADFLDVHRTTIREQMELAEGDRVVVPYNPVGVPLPDGLRFDPVDIAAAEADDSPVVGRVGFRAQDHSGEIASGETAAGTASEAAGDREKVGVVLHLGARSFDFSLPF